MAKKTFAKGIDAILGGFEAENEIHETNLQKPLQKKNIQKESLENIELNESLKDIETESEKQKEIRTTVFIEAELMEAIKAYAYWDRKLFKDIVHESMTKYIESKNPDDVKRAIDCYRLKQMKNA